MENNVLDYSLILENCGIDSLPPNLVVKNIANLEECTGISIEILRDICSSQINNGRGR